MTRRDLHQYAILVGFVLAVAVLSVYGGVWFGLEGVR